MSLVLLWFYLYDSKLIQVFSFKMVQRGWKSHYRPAMLDDYNDINNEQSKGPLEVKELARASKKTRRLILNGSFETENLKDRFRPT